eukprot:5035516-Lingulodinium_polyedra.AAC.1
MSVAGVSSMQWFSVAGTSVASISGASVLVGVMSGSAGMSSTASASAISLYSARVSGSVWSVLDSEKKVSNSSSSIESLSRCPSSSPAMSYGAVSA